MTLLLIGCAFAQNLPRSFFDEATLLEQVIGDLQLSCLSQHRELAFLANQGATLFDVRIDSHARLIAMLSYRQKKSLVLSLFASCPVIDAGASYVLKEHVGQEFGRISNELCQLDDDFLLQTLKLSRSKVDNYRRFNRCPINLPKSSPLSPNETFNPN